MKYLSDIDEIRAAMSNIDFSRDIDNPQCSFVNESQNTECYHKVQKILDVPEMIKGHKRCLDINFDDLQESDIETVNKLYDLGVERGFISPDEENSDSQETDEVCPNCGESPCICMKQDVKDIGDGSQMYDVDAAGLYESYLDAMDDAVRYDMAHPEPGEFDDMLDDTHGNDKYPPSGDYRPDEFIGDSQIDTATSDVVYENPDDLAVETEDTDGGEEIQDEQPVEPTQDAPEPTPEAPEQPETDPVEQPQETPEQPEQTSSEEPTTDDSDEQVVPDENTDSEDTADTADDIEEKPEEDSDETEDSDDSDEDSEDESKEDEPEDAELSAEEKKQRKDAYTELWRQTLRDLEIATPLKEVTDPSKKAEFWEKISNGWEKEDPSEFMKMTDLEKLESSEKVDDVEDKSDEDDSDSDEDTDEEKDTETSDDKGE